MARKRRLALLEICVDTISSLNAAIAGGADRVELCSALAVGGLSPSVGLMEAARSAPIPVYVMVRPRAGDFDYSEPDLVAMEQEIAAARSLGFPGVVFGAGSQAGLHMERLKRLCAAAENLGKTLHRVVDLLPERLSILPEVRALGFERVLTSGGAPKAECALDELGQLVRAAPDGLTIMPGSGVTPENAGRILSATGASEIHASASVSGVPLDGKLSELGFSGGQSKIATPESVRRLKQACLAVQTARRGL